MLKLLMFKGKLERAGGLGFRTLAMWWEHLVLTLYLKK